MKRASTTVSMTVKLARMIEFIYECGLRRNVSGFMLRRTADVITESGNVNRVTQYVDTTEVCEELCDCLVKRSWSVNEHNATYTLDPSTRDMIVSEYERLIQLARRTSSPDHSERPEYTFGQYVLSIKSDSVLQADCSAFLFFHDSETRIRFVSGKNSENYYGFTMTIEDIMFGNNSSPGMRNAVYAARISGLLK